MAHNNRNLIKQSYIANNDARAKKAIVDYLKSLSFEDIEAKEDFTLMSQLRKIRIISLRLR